MITQVYPNPASSNINFNIHFKNENNNSGTIEIIDLMGKNIIEETFHTGVNSIDISSLAKGMYIYKVSNSNSSVQGKFIVN
jgi:type IX secretion system substrate protein